MLSFFECTRRSRGAALVDFGQNGLIVLLADLAFWADLALSTLALLRVLADFAHSWLFGLARFALSVDLCRVEHFLRFAFAKLLGERGALAETLLHVTLAHPTWRPRGTESNRARRTRLPRSQEAYLFGD